MDLHSKPSWLDLESIIPLEKRKRRSRRKEDGKRSAEEITTLSRETIKRRYPDRIRRLSEHREGIKLRDALEIAEGQ
jgi:hypothetical protein